MNDLTTVEIDLESPEFLSHAEFLTKVRVTKSLNGKFELSYPKKLKSFAEFKKYFEFLLWFWFMSNVESQMQNKPIGVDYSC